MGQYAESRSQHLTFETGSASFHPALNPRAGGELAAAPLEVHHASLGVGHALAALIAGFFVPGLPLRSGGSAGTLRGTTGWFLRHAGGRPDWRSEVGSGPVPPREFRVRMEMATC
jgi:hypothetical protein